MKNTLTCVISWVSISISCSSSTSSKTSGRVACLSWSWESSCTKDEWEDQSKDLEIGREGGRDRGRKEQERKKGGEKGRERRERRGRKRKGGWKKVNGKRELLLLFVLVTSYSISSRRCVLWEGTHRVYTLCNRISTRHVSTHKMHSPSHSWFFVSLF